MPEPIVIIESPYSHPTAQGLIIHRLYQKFAMLDSISRCEAPFAGHGFYTQYLNDRDEKDRKLGMRLSRNFLYASSLVAVYSDLGVSPGMLAGIRLANLLAKPIEYRLLGITWSDLKKAAPKN